MMPRFNLPLSPAMEGDLQLMLSLRIEKQSSTFPGTDYPGIETAFDTAGRVCSHVLQKNGQFWINIPGIASFFFGKESHQISAFPEPTAEVDLVKEGFQRIVVPMALQAQGMEVLHGSSILTPKGVIVFCAVSGTGKSTFAAAMKRRNYTLWSDDALPFKSVGEHIDVISLPFHSRLLPDAAVYLRNISPESARPNPMVAYQEASLFRILILMRKDRSSRNRTEFVTLPPEEALRSVLSHSWCFSLKDSSRKKKMMSHYLDLVSRVPVVELRFREGLENLTDTLDELENWLKGER